MTKDQTIGILLFVGAISAIIIYGWMIYADLWWWAFLIIVSILVIGVMGIIAWIGYTMATTPPPEPIEYEESTDT